MNDILDVSFNAGSARLQEVIGHRSTIRSPSRAGMKNRLYVRGLQPCGRDRSPFPRVKPRGVLASSKLKRKQYPGLLNEPRSLVFPLSRRPVPRERILACSHSGVILSTRSTFVNDAYTASSKKLNALIRRFGSKTYYHGWYRLRPTRGRNTTSCRPDIRTSG